MLSRRGMLKLSATTALIPALMARPVRAQAWPSRFVRLVVPFPAGGGIDSVARIVAAKLSEAWNQQVVIDNRGGAGGNIAADLVARAEPDGYTMFIGAIGLYAAIHPVHFYIGLTFHSWKREYRIRRRRATIGKIAAFKLVDVYAANAGRYIER